MKVNTAETSRDPASERIVLALSELLKKKQQYKSISVSEIAKTAGVSRQAFYLNFKDRDEVLKQLLHRMFSDIMDTVRAEKADTVENLVRVYTAVVERHSDFLKILAVNELGSFLSQEFVKELIEREPVLKIQKEPKDKDERLYINSFWVSAFTDVYAVWLKGGMTTGKEELNEILTDIMTGAYFS